MAPERLVLYGLDKYDWSLPWSKVFTLEPSPEMPLNRWQGPHDYETICVLYASLLGTCHGEKRNGSVRFFLEQENSNAAYLSWYHTFFVGAGYIQNKWPRLRRRSGLRGEIRWNFELRTWHFATLTWVFNAFYRRGVKGIPYNLEEFLSPLAVCVWVQRMGVREVGGIRIKQTSISLADQEFFSFILWKKYGIRAVPYRFHNGQYGLFITIAGAPIVSRLAEQCRPYIESFD